MNAELETDYVARMAELDHTFMRVSGLTDRRSYKIFYSHVHRFPLMVIGFNPGGSPDQEDLYSASGTYFEHWEHDFVRFRSQSGYPLAKPMFELLSEVVGAQNPILVRHIPVTNVIFHRARGMDGVAGKYAKEAAPVLSKLLEIVQPLVVLVISKTAYSLFQHLYCVQVSDHCADPLTTPNGSSPAVVYTHCSATLRSTDQRVRLICTGHPSKYASRPIWRSVVENVRQQAASFGADPRELRNWLHHIPDLVDHS
jgi:hypothetical protein